MLAGESKEMKSKSFVDPSGRQGTVSCVADVWKQCEKAYLTYSLAF